MNAPEIVAMCKNIYTDYVGMGREKANEDKFVLATIMYMYNNTGIDWEEVALDAIFRQRHLRFSDCDLYSRGKNERVRRY